MEYAEFDTETNHFLDITLMHEDDNYSSESRAGTDEEENWDDDDYIGKDCVQATKTVAAKNEPKIGEFDLSEMCIEFSEEELKEMLRLPATAKILPATVEAEDTRTKIENTCDSNNEEIPSKDIAKNENGKAVSSSETASKTAIEASSNAASDAQKSAIDNIPMPELKRPGKIPNIIWQQSDSIVCIKIHVPDVKDYKLKVTPSTVYFR